MQRFWVSWWSGYYESEGCTKPPFQVWISGSRDRSHPNGGDEVSICAVIDAPSEADIWPVVEKHFPDCERRFCTECEPGWIPNNRFPDFKGETSLTAQPGA